MKASTLTKIFLVFSLCIAMSTARAQYVSIPDVNFGNWLNANGFSSCLTGNGTVGWQMDTTCSAVVNATNLSCDYANISDFEGIEYFDNVSSFTCNNNTISNLPAFPPHLAFFQCNSSQLQYLPFNLPNSLTYMDVSNNNLYNNVTSLPPNLVEYHCMSNYTQFLPSLPSTLTVLDCGSNVLASMPALPASLTNLYCTVNNLPSLPALPASLQELGCGGNQLTTLPTLPASLTFLGCTSNPMTGGLPALPASLINLQCDYDQLTILPALPASLTTLNCNGNNFAGGLPLFSAGLQDVQCTFCHLTSLPALNAGLQTLDCSNNQLTSIPALPASLGSLSCSSNQLTNLPTLPPLLNTLVCSINQLSNLPVIPASMLQLFCDNNLLTSIPALPSALYSLRCDNNHLTSITNLPQALIIFTVNDNPNLACLPRIYQTQFNQFTFNHTSLTCFPNRFSALTYDINPATKPLCTPSSGCDFYYNISGNVHYDSSATCLLDSLHQGAPITNMKVQLKQGGSVIQQFYTFTSGGYSFKTPSLSTYTVDIDTTALPVSVVCPQSGVRPVALSVTDSVHKYENFGMNCSSVDFGVIDIIGSRFRPTFQTTVHINTGDIALIKYNAHCGSGVSGTVTTTFTNAVHYVSPAPGALTPSSVTGSTITYTLADLSTLHTGSLDIILSVDTGAVVGSSICITSTITSSVTDSRPADNTLTQCFTILHSWDPNYKEVYPTTLSPSGGWLNYTIHFQNTGTDTAYLVVLKDTLSTYVDASSFQYLASSHHAVIQLFGSAMVFTFPKINLVDSATNPALSEGWIQYRVKANSNLALGTQVKNTAYIYFDNNPAVVTNTTINTVSNCVSTTTPVSQSFCAGDTFVFYTQHLTSGGTYADTLHSVGGCDSMIVLTLTANPSYAATKYDTICSGSTYSFYGQALSAAGTYSHTLQTVYGCDSVIDLALAVHALPVVTFTLDSMLHRGYVGGADTFAYWYCGFPDSFPLVGGSPAGGTYSGLNVQNDSLFAIVPPGIDTITYTYIAPNGCTSSASVLIHTEACTDIGIHDLPGIGTVSLYPNPNKGTFTLQTSNSIHSDYTITDMLGDVIEQKSITSDKQAIDLTRASAGVYTLSVKGAQPIRFVVMR